MGLTTFAAVFRFVRAVVDAVHSRAARRQNLRHLFVDPVDHFFGKEPAGNTGLVCHHNHRESTLIQPANRRSGKREDAEAA
jgi:hypothetical protein